MCSKVDREMATAALKIEGYAKTMWTKSEIRHIISPCNYGAMKVYLIQVKCSFKNGFLIIITLIGTVSLFYVFITTRFK